VEAAREVVVVVVVVGGGVGRKAWVVTATDNTTRAGRMGRTMAAATKAKEIKSS